MTLRLGQRMPSWQSKKQARSLETPPRVGHDGCNLGKLMPEATGLEAFSHLQEENRRTEWAIGQLSKHSMFDLWVAVGG